MIMIKGEQVLTALISFDITETYGTEEKHCNEGHVIDRRTSAEQTTAHHGVRR